MLQLSQHNCKNLLLRSLAQDDFDALVPHLQHVDYARGDSIIQSGETIETIVFPESGIFSITLSSSDNRKIEVGIYGREGLSDGSIFAGIHKIPHDSFVQVPGSGLRISAEVLLEIATERPVFHRSAIRWLHISHLQTAQTALANGTYNVEERLARWLLMCQDRIGPDVALTHDFLSVMLAVQRSTVTLATHILEGARLIRATRGNIRILNREGLLAIADGCYGSAEDEYERIIGPFRY
ncbi:hypothetical protein FP2506_17629 [Fulvimarina pelagi HTCC2506]|uniref:Cyclic nucleotide-binding domain-containing protein n=1 Tax=Fulvimarina pelagi HTCC2506 TaxID=314231 RepID=Q0FY22_9HYPH|nr:Crp/Fnr family transcriptional regulator [Fulvimarina pelagi]EAU39920.1 hypothetical protein FP2506_17629 [Fulvimarina pelagi HTCC2506]